MKYEKIMQKFPELKQYKIKIVETRWALLSGGSVANVKKIMSLGILGDIIIPFFILLTSVMSGSILILVAGVLLVATIMFSNSTATAYFLKGMFRENLDCFVTVSPRMKGVIRDFVVAHELAHISIGLGKHGWKKERMVDEIAGKRLGLSKKQINDIRKKIGY